MSERFHLGPVAVRVPATSANIGPGFDALALALAIHDEVHAEVVGSGLAIDVTGEGTGEVALDESHLVVQAMRATFDVLGGQPAGLRLKCVNRIPHGRGLGSSAAAIVAGVVLAQSLTVSADLGSPDLLALAAAIEGHPDNVAACLLGGLTIAWSDASGTARALRLEPAALTPVLLIPGSQSSTKAARRVLPEVVPHTDAAFNAARSALLVAALTTGATDVLWEATQDRLHQGYRAPSQPESSELLGRLRQTGLAAVISGAGPSVLVLAKSQSEVETARELAGSAWRVGTPALDRQGAHLF